MWLLHRPLCAFVGVESVNPGSRRARRSSPARADRPDRRPRGGRRRRRRAARPAVPGASSERDGRATGRSLAVVHPARVLTGVGVAIGLVIVGAPARHRDPDPDEHPGRTDRPDRAPSRSATSRSRSSGRAIRRRFVVGFVVAAVGWFVILYPNISALPLPSAVVAAYQGILPTYLYAFQFPVSTVDRSTRHAAPHADARGPAVVALPSPAWSSPTRPGSWRLALADSRGPAAGRPTMPTASPGAGGA